MLGSLRRWPGLREVAILAGLWIAYTLSRALVSGDTAEAVARGKYLLRVEERMGIDFELGTNLWATGVPVVAVVACYAYASLHYVVTGGVMIWLYRRRPALYPAARTSLVVMTLAALVCFTLFPTAPPRLLGTGTFLDTMAEYAGWGWWSEAASSPKGLGSMTNQYAALPSMHAGWAVWCALWLWRGARGPRTTLLRAAAVAYPLFVSIVVVVTGNHYFLDIAAGVAVALAADMAVPATRRTRLVSQPGTPAGRPG